MTRDNPLTIETEIREAIGYLHLEGELVAESRFEPEQIMREWLDSGLVRIIILCGALTHIDSAGLSTLLGALHRLRRQGGDLILAEMNPSLNSIFELTSMEKYFNIFTTLEAAEEHFMQVDHQSRKAPLQPGNAKSPQA